MLKSYTLKLKFIAVCALAGLFPAHAQEDSAATADLAAAPSTMEVRDAITEAVIFMQKRATNDSSAFILPPGRSRKVTGHKEVVRRYRKVEVPRRVPIHETYETTEAVQRGSSTGATIEMRKVTKRRIVGWKTEGTREVLRRDPDGPIERTERRPVWGSGGPDKLFPGFYAQNAMGIYLLVRAGVDPKSMPLAESIDSLTDYIDGFGLPDRTWDLAWVTAVYVNLAAENDELEDLSRRLVSKLLLAQISDGPGNGMWGPSSLSPEFIAAMLKGQKELIREHVREWEEKLKRSGDREKYGPRIAEGRRIVDEFNKQLIEYSRMALDFGGYERHQWKELELDADEHVRARSDWQMSPSAYRYRFAINPFIQRPADMKSTAVVLFALREAARNQLLPEAPQVPRGVEDKPVMKVRSTKAIVAAAAKAIVQRQAPNGTFTQGLSWQPDTTLEESGLAQFKSERAPNLHKKSQLTLLSTAEGYIALADAATLLGTGGSRYSRRLAVSQQVVTEMIEGLLDGDMRGLKVGEQPLATYRFAFLAGRLLDTDFGRTGEGRELWNRLAKFLLDKRHAKRGIWVQDRQRTFSPSIDEILSTWRSNQAEKWVKAHQEEAKKWQNPVERRTAQLLRNDHNRWGTVIEGNIAATTYATVLLLQGARPPVVGAWNWHGNGARTATIEPVLRKLEQQNGVRLDYVQLNPALPRKHTADVPILFVSGAGKFECAAPQEYPANLAAYLEEGGILVAEAPANAQGDAFINGLKQIIMELADESSAMTVPAGEGLPEIQGIRNANGRMIAALLRIGDPEQPRTLAPGQAMQFVYNLVKLRVQPELFTPDYLVNWQAVEQARAQ